MKTNVMGRINRLTAERARLYFHAGRDRADFYGRRRLLELDRELELLWDARRQERAGRREGIDLIIDRIYAGVYGPAFDDTPARNLVEESGDRALLGAA